jgi:phosphomannomutase
LSADARAAPDRPLDRPIRFGTSGWRGTLGDEITAPRLRALAAAVARWAAEEAPARARVLVGHDTRFLGAELARAALAALADAGADARAAASPVPTPVVARAVREGRADAGWLVTASHNRPADQGVKVLAAWGGGVTAEQARRIESLAAEALARPPARSAGRARAERVDLVAPYLSALARHVDGRAARGRRVAVIYDALHGTGSGVVDRALRGLGARVALRNERQTPRFGGRAPDPTPDRLAELGRALRAGRGARLGLATDGDADRYAVVDESGRALSETESLALLVDHLAASGRVRRGVALSIATGTLVEAVARDHGLAVERHPIGFKYLARALAEGRADVAGEESGGFAWEPVARDKDGILACALFVEMVAATGVSPRERLRALARRYGRRVSGRLAYPARPAARARLAALASAPPARVGPDAVTGIDLRDGVWLGLADGFLMLRASGTEGVLRVYAEAPDRHALARRFEIGADWLGLR